MNSGELKFEKQELFPLLDQYSRVFAITDKTIFAYNNTIYCNYPLPPDLIIHEQTHFKQQKKYGLDEWVMRYLMDDKFRLEQEVEAYRNQLASIKSREQRFHLWITCSEQLASDLYSNIVTKEEAKKLLK
jgi:hypothetical protein